MVKIFAGKYENTKAQLSVAKYTKTTAQIYICNIPNVVVLLQSSTTNQYSIDTDDAGLDDWFTNKFFGIQDNFILPYIHLSVSNSPKKLQELQSEVPTPQWLYNIRVLDKHVYFIVLVFP